MNGLVASIGLRIITLATRLWRHRATLFGLFVEANAQKLTKPERFVWVFEELIADTEIAAILGLKDTKSRDLARAIVQIFFYIWTWRLG